MEITNQQIQEYINLHHTQEPELLARLRKETYQKTLQPYMISGEYQGRVLSLISKIMQPKSILEIGTFTGYSSLCLAEGLQKNGQLVTIDNNDEIEHISSDYFAQSEFKNQILYKRGLAMDLLPTIKQKFDLIFIDADKANYINYYNLCLPKLNANGILLIDNVLWYGKVLKPAKPKDNDTKIIQQLNESIAQDKRVEVVILPIRDGISLVRKK